MLQVVALLNFFERNVFIFLSWKGKMIVLCCVLEHLFALLFEAHITCSWCCCRASDDVLLDDERDILLLFRPRDGDCVESETE